MSTTSAQLQSWPTSEILYTLLPGPDTRRKDATYCYRLTYRNSEASAVGCVLIWEVTGGRLSYQLALERDEKGELRLHCTCADATYRAEELGRPCKHVRGLLSFASPGHALLELETPLVCLPFQPPVSPRSAVAEVA